MNYQSFELPLTVAETSRLNKVDFPISMQMLNQRFICGLFVSMASSSFSLNDLSISGGALISQRSVTNCLVNLFSSDTDYKFDRVPLSYFANIGGFGFGTLGQGQRPAQSFKWPEVNQKIDWNQSYLEFTEPILQPESIMFFVKYG